MKQRFNNIRKFQSSGKIEKKSIWDKLDDYAAKAEIPLAIGAAGAAMTTAATGGLAVPTMILNVGSAGIDAYQAARNLYKGNYAQAALDGAELLASLFGTKVVSKALSTGYKSSKAAARAAKISRIPVNKRARYIRTHPTVFSPKESEAASKIFVPLYGVLSPVARSQAEPSEQTVPVDNIREDQRRTYKNGGTVEDSTKGRFTFRKSQTVKDAEKLNGKRDMRKKLVKSDVVTNKKKRIQKGQQGLKFASYNAVETPIYATEIADPFSAYNFPSTYRQYLTQEEPQVSSQKQVIEQIETPKEKVEEKPKQKTEVARITDHIYKDRNKWVQDLKSAYKRAGITNENALKMLLAQDALESGWGKSAQGKFNYGNLTPGSSWKGEVVVGRDKNGKGQAIQQKFRSYNSIDEYAADKVQFLKSLYDFDENDDIATFTRKLQGGNRGKRRYAEGNNYVQLVTKIYNTSKL